jgi:hypothetical protein
MRREIDPLLVREPLTKLQISLSSSTAPSVMRKMRGIESVVSANSFKA